MDLNFIIVEYPISMKDNNKFENYEDVFFESMFILLKFKTIMLFS